jgi:outer membrane protein TolC
LAEEAIVTTIPYTLEQAREIAYASRPELKSFEAQRKAQDQTIATARRGHLPDLIFDASYGRRHVSNESENGRTLNTFPLQPTWSVQLSLNVPILTVSERPTGLRRRCETITSSGTKKSSSGSRLPWTWSRLI